MGAGRVVQRVLSLPRRRWRALGRAILELAIARLRLRADHSGHLRQAKSARRSTTQPLSAAQATLIEEVAFAIPRAAARVPWRADCLVQALAGERWLRRRGIAAQVVIGVRNPAVVPLDAHAWLEYGDRIITGGDVATFVPLTD